MSSPPPRVGDPAPDFEGQTGTGQRIRLADYRGRYLILYFYPRAFTPGCTRETYRFRDNYSEIRALGADVVGVSSDEPAVQCDFSNQTAAPFPLLADSNHRVSSAYGARRLLMSYDKRLTYIIDPAGVIAARFAHEFQIDRHLDDVLNFLRKANGSMRAT